ncbi:hypothetical protein RTP6_000632 [Batrachochytrium dendrobatidis]
MPDKSDNVKVEAQSYPDLTSPDYSQPASKHQEYALAKECSDYSSQTQSAHSTTKLQESRQSPQLPLFMPDAQIPSDTTLPHPLGVAKSAQKYSPFQYHAYSQRPPHMYKDDGNADQQSRTYPALHMTPTSQFSTSDVSQSTTACLNTSSVNADVNSVNISSPMLSAEHDKKVECVSKKSTPPSLSIPLPLQNEPSSYASRYHVQPSPLSSTHDQYYTYSGQHDRQQYEACSKKEMQTSTWTSRQQTLPPPNQYHHVAYDADPNSNRMIQYSEDYRQYPRTTHYNNEQLRVAPRLAAPFENLDEKPISLLQPGTAPKRSLRDSLGNSSSSSVKKTQRAYSPLHDNQQMYYEQPKESSPPLHMKPLPRLKMLDSSDMVNRTDVSPAGKNHSDVSLHSLNVTKTGLTPIHGIPSETLSVYGGEIRSNQPSPAHYSVNGQHTSHQHDTVSSYQSEYYSRTPYEDVNQSNGSAQKSRVSSNMICDNVPTKVSRSNAVAQNEFNDEEAEMDDEHHKYNSGHAKIPNHDTQDILASKAKDTRRYECQYCSKRFSRPSSLTTHIYTHTGERPFGCDIPGCGRSFSVLSNLRRHNRVCQRTRERRLAALEGLTMRENPYSADPEHKTHHQYIAWHAAAHGAGRAPEFRLAREAATRGHQSRSAPTGDPQIPPVREGVQLKYEKYSPPQGNTVYAANDHLPPTAVASGVPRASYPSHRDLLAPIRSMDGHRAAPYGRMMVDPMTGNYYSSMESTMAQASGMRRSAHMYSPSMRTNSQPPSSANHINSEKDQAGLFRSNHPGYYETTQPMTDRQSGRMLLPTNAYPPSHSRPQTGVSPSYMENASFAQEYPHQMNIPTLSKSQSMLDSGIGESVASSMQSSHEGRRPSRDMPMLVPHHLPPLSFSQSCPENSAQLSTSNDFTRDTRRNTSHMAESDLSDKLYRSSRACDRGDQQLDEHSNRFGTSLHKTFSDETFPLTSRAVTRSPNFVH